MLKIKLLHELFDYNILAGKRELQLTSDADMCTARPAVNILWICRFLAQSNPVWKYLFEKSANYQTALTVQHVNKAIESLFSTMYCPYSSKLEHLTNKF